VTARLRCLVTLAIVAIAACGPAAASGAPASPLISCLGIPPVRCDEALASVARSLPNTVPVSIEVSCVAGTCTSESGAMDTVVTLADGNQLRSTTISWSEDSQPHGGLEPLPAPVPAAVVPVEPACLGVPAAMCLTMAETAFGELSDQEVVRILVRCGTPPCTAEHGVGDTVVTYADGTSRTSTWEYAGG
jgi:hypothetical protein